MIEDIGADLEMKTTRRKAPGKWVEGTVSGYRFEALVFPEHAQIEGIELEDSRISKLWIQRLADKKNVYNFDRGLDIAPLDDDAAQVVAFLAAGLAESVYG